MSYTCKDFGEGMVCDGCPHNMFGSYDSKPQPKYRAPSVDGMNRAQRRAAAVLCSSALEKSNRWTLRVERPGTTNGESNNTRYRND
jgi:hypothetical protein